MGSKINKRKYTLKNNRKKKRTKIGGVKNEYHPKGTDFLTKKKCCKIAKIFSESVEFSQDNKKKSVVSRSDMLRLAHTSPFIANAIDWVKIKPILKNENLLTLPKMPTLPKKFPLSIPKRPQLPLSLSDEEINVITSKFENQEKKTAFKEIASPIEDTDKFLDASFQDEQIVGLSPNGTIIPLNESKGRYDLDDLPTSSGFVAMSCGLDHCVSLLKDGNVATWGSNTIEQRNNIPTKSNFVAIACGFWHNVGLDEDGSITIWGDATGGQYVDAPTGENNKNFVAIACGYHHTVALRNDGTTMTWGFTHDDDEFDNYATFNTLYDEVNKNFVAIASGYFHVVGLRKDGTVVTWGDDEEGQYNNDEPDGENNKNFVAIACGDKHSVALRNDGSVVTWGNRSSQSHHPTNEENKNFIAIDCGRSLSMGLRNDGTIAIWGRLADRINVEGNNYVKIKCGKLNHVAFKKDGTFDKWEFKEQDFIEDTE